MNISLTPELERYIHEKLDSGLYTSVSEVIRESLRLMHSYDGVQKNQIDQLNQAIEIGMKQLKAGNKVSAEESYRKMKKKINDIAKERE
ncbi:MAG: type II toxin-antitoxin system ParD family antitoxin [Gammaproteobacteria bacterium]